MSDAVVPKPFDELLPSIYSALASIDFDELDADGLVVFMEECSEIERLLGALRVKLTASDG